MKAHILLFFCLIAANLYSQTISINNEIPGELNQKMVMGNYNSKEVTDLSLSGYINAKDIAYININMTNLKNIDLYKCTIDDYAIPEGAFRENNNIERVVLPQKTKTIEIGAFAFCENLKEIIFSSYLETLGVCSFEGCINLKTIDFSICTELSNVFKASFSDCKSLKFVDLSKCLKLNYIADGMFSGCDLLTEILLPQSIEIIRSNAFQNCYLLKKIDFSKCNVKEIQGSAFSDCVSLKEVVLPKTIKTLDYGVFYNCTSLRFFTIMASTPPTLYMFIFSNTSYSSCKLIVPEGSKTKYQTAQFWDSFDTYNNIFEITDEFPTDILTIKKQYLIITHNSITINNLSIKTNVELYGINGNVIYSNANSTNQLIIDNLNQGIYILKVGKMIKKISVH